MNKGTTKQVISIDRKSIGVGKNFYVYSFTGGTDNGEFSQYVTINGYGPSINHWGPYEDLFDIPANSYSTGNGIKLTSPARSIQMIMIEGGNDFDLDDGETNDDVVHSYYLYQNYPNPFNSLTEIKYNLSEDVYVTLKIFDVLGNQVETLVHEHQDVGNHSVLFDASRLSSGVYFYRLQAGNYNAKKKLLLLK